MFTPTPPLFRAEAVRSLSSPDSLDALLKVTRPSGWLVVAGVGLLSVLLLAWSWMGALPVRVTLPGLLISTQAIAVVTAQQSGQVQSVQAQTGVEVSAGAPVMQWQDRRKEGTVSSDDLHTLTAPVAGKWVNVVVKTGQFVERGTPVGWLEPQSPPDTPPHQQTMVLVLAPLSLGQALQSGLPAQVRCTQQGTSTQTQAASTVWQARIDRLAAYPVPQHQIGLHTGHEALGQMLNSDPAVRPMWLRWEATADQPQTFPVKSGQWCEVSITLSAERPIAKLLPFLARRT